MPKGIVFELCLLNSDLVVQSRQRLRVTLSSGPEICAETNWLSIQKKLQEFCKKRGWCNCKVQYNNGSALEELCDSNSLRRWFDLHREALLRDAVELPLYVVPDPTDDTPPFVIDGEEIVLEVDQQGSPILLKLRSDVLLGEGGFGQVWRVRDTESQTAYGVKIVKSSLRDGRSQEHMETEISALLKLNHPNIIKVLQHGYILDPVRGRLPAYMMDLGRCSVQDLLETGWHTKAAAEAAQRDMSSALQHFHAAGLGHMDVKPANWLVANKFTGSLGETQLELKLIDAGGAGRLGKDKVTSFTADYAHPLHRGEFPSGFHNYCSGLRNFLMRVHAFFDWYGLRKAIYVLSSFDSESKVHPYRRAFKKAAAAVDSDRVFFMDAVRENGWVLFYACKTVQNDKDVVMEAVRQTGFALACASEALRGDREVVMEAVRQKGFALQYACVKFRGDKEVVLEAVCQNGLALDFASDELKADKEVVAKAVRQNSRALGYACVKFMSDKDFIMNAVHLNGFALELACDTLQGDKEVVTEAVRQNGTALEYASEDLKGDREVVMEAARQDGHALAYASQELKGDKEVVMQAVRQDGLALLHASEELNGDKEVVMEAVRQDGRFLLYASLALKSDKEVVMEAVRTHGAALRFASWGLSSDKEVVMEAVRQDGKALRYACLDLQSDPDVIACHGFEP